MGDIAAEVKLDFKPVGEGYFVAALQLFAVDDKLFGETSDDVAGDVAGHKGDGQAVGALHFFPNTFGVELDDGTVGE